MAQTDARAGFRLPWSADRGDAATTDTQEPTTTDAQVDGFCAALTDAVSGIRARAGL